MTTAPVPAPSSTKESPPVPDPYDLIAEAERVHAINPSALRSFEHQLIAALKEVMHERDGCQVEALARRSAIPAAISMKGALARVTKERDEAVALLESLPGDDDSVLAEEQWSEQYRCFLAQLADPIGPRPSRASLLRAVAS